MPVHPLKRWRFERGVAQHELAELAKRLDAQVKLTQGYLSMIERGISMPSPKVARALSRATGRKVTIGEIRRFGNGAHRNGHRNGRR